MKTIFILGLALLGAFDFALAWMCHLMERNDDIRQRRP